jgi:prepilin-type N-terminal cleavage/methylation domain-containing protein
MKSARRHRHGAREAGFTLIEVLIAMTILATGALSLVLTFDSSRRLTTDAELRDVAATVARGEIERLESLSWSNLALAAEPTKNPGATTKDPTYYITECGSVKCYSWDSSHTSNYEKFVINKTTEDASANPKPWKETISTSNGSVRVEGSIYRFITWVNDEKCKATACTNTTEDYKRITVAVTSGRLNSPVTLSTLWVNPVGGKASPLVQEGVKCNDSGSKVACTH